ncbi:mucin-2-like isoform X2 [Physella acuta]|uniref:mucin-2-like isoform X2 n=1 Tax=Physella acuta TaxID=109671 RepID=UPI0027DD99A2|nr:mucin-2-like isoform X2 [Physella acuta]
MELYFHISVILLSVYLADGQSNVPNDPLWPVFSQTLAQQMQRTVQDINTLGLSDPSINYLWNAYKAQMPAPTPTPTTTPPPLPDLYQSSYMFSSNTLAQPAPAAPAAPSNDVYATLLNMIQQPTSGTSGTSAGTSTGSTSTSLQDVYRAYSQMPAATNSQTDPYAMLRQYSGAMGSPTTGTADVTSLLQQYASIMQAAQTGSNPAPAAPATSTLLQQAAPSAPNTGTAPNYAQLYQQYLAIMGMNTTLAPTSASAPADAGVAPTKAGPTQTEQLIQMFNMMSAASAPQTTPTPPTVSAYEQQLATFFPQFKNLFPSQGANSPSTNGTGNSSADATQIVFDALLFGPTYTTSAPPTAAQTTPNPNIPAVLNPLQNMINPPAESGAHLLSNHVENVFKTKASRELGCRFLPELLELDLLPTAPIDCLGKCPFPYINSQKFGVYCLCCPPGVNEHTAGMMSIVRRASYMETPLAVIS